MANKTIGELNAISTINNDDVFAMYNGGTGKVTKSALSDAILSDLDNKNFELDTQDQTLPGAINELNTEIDNKVNTSTYNTKIGQIEGAIGNTDISEIGDGSVSGAIDQLNTSLDNYVLKTGDTITGPLTLQGHRLTLQGDRVNTNYKSTVIDSDIGGTVPSETIHLGGMYINDKNDVNNGWVRIYKNPSDSLYWNICLRRNVNGELLSNQLSLGINASGQKYVTVNGLPAWQSALGISSLFSNASNRNTITFNNIICAGFVTGAQKTIGFFIPYGDYIGGIPTFKTLNMCVRSAEGGYPWVRSGSNGSVYTQLGSANISIVTNNSYTRTNEINTIRVNGRRGSGFEIAIDLNYEVAKANGNTAPVTNNIPIAVSMTGEIILS